MSQRLGGVLGRSLRLAEQGREYLKLSRAARFKIFHRLANQPQRKASAERESPVRIAFHPPHTETGRHGPEIHFRTTLAEIGQAVA